jgi:hypothetical protein
VESDRLPVPVNEENDTGRAFDTEPGENSLHSLELLLLNNKRRLSH